ncbi:DJ-1/PfpI family protein [Sporolactobacillus laevolacticus]|uniref:Dimethyladenosine transferase n=1 Tax=Sporolactobacillus laevolacticus DSM 442 TaxID=1395513 RepID=V6IXI8_9BACL|nr:DJ-1/PfpI family protein [Sporolactobacillus laevolacticus]EST11371.1 dimethyladenosine transferase [Sporolactobacillus laevolacticus DSM 442]
MDVNILLFPDFETLDAFGPVEVLGQISEYTLRYVSMDGGTITSRQKTPIMTEPIHHTDVTGILLIPGGQGTRPLVNNDDFIRKLGDAANLSTYCLTVCTGSALLARTSLLNGRKATSNKLAFEWVKSVNPSVQWMEHARWVNDGKYYTSSGVSAGIDMTLGFIADQFGEAQAREIAHHIEYVWNSDKTNDPFSIC